jgi:hypothetical protein
VPRIVSDGVSRDSWFETGVVERKEPRVARPLESCARLRRLTRSKVGSRGGFNPST